MAEEGIATKPNSADEEQPYNTSDGKYLPKENASVTISEGNNAENHVERSVEERERGGLPQDQWAKAKEIGPVEQQAIDACKAQKPMPFSLFDESPAYRKATEEYANLEVITDETPNYQALVQGAIDDGRKMLFGTKPKAERKAFICLGLPASGKSSSLAARCNPEAGYAEMDSDKIKGCESLKEYYHEGLGAGCVQLPSSDALDALSEEGMKEGYNMAFPMVASNIKRFKSFLDKLQSYGYEIEIELNKTPVGYTIPRLVKRYLESGRYISPTYIKHAAKTCQAVYKEIETKYKEKGEIDGVRIKSFKKTGL